MVGEDGVDAGGAVAFGDTLRAESLLYVLPFRGPYSGQVDSQASLYDLFNDF